MTQSAGGRPDREPAGAQEPEARRKKRLKITAISVAAVLAVVVLGLSFFLWSYSRDDGLIFDNVYALNLNLSGMTQEPGRPGPGDPGPKPVWTVPGDSPAGRDLVLPPENTKVRLDAQAMAEAAYQYGRDGNMFDRGARPVGGCPQHPHHGGGRFSDPG